MQYYNELLIFISIVLGKMALNLKGDELLETKQMVNKLKVTHSNTIDDCNNKPTLNKINIGVDDVIEAISQCKNNKSPGIDNITNELIKNGGDSIVNTLHIMFKRFTELESIPDEWNKGIIVPIHKKGDKSDLNNYRGITLNSCTSKIYTKIITKNISNFLESNDTLSEIQGGFRPDRRCEDHIFNVKSITSIRKLEGKTTYMGLLGLQKSIR